VLDGARKYSTSGGKEELYDLSADPAEQEDLVLAGHEDALPARREALSRALLTPAGLAFRLRPERGGGREDLEVELRVPGGVRAAWVGADPTEKSAATARVEGEVVHATWRGGLSGSREVFVVPEQDALAVAPGLALDARRGAAHDLATRDPDDPLPAPDGRPHRLLQADVGGRVSLTWAVVPQPPEGARELGGYDPETADALKALGYLEEEEPQDPEPPTDR
jgi:hypothetical protein